VQVNIPLQFQAKKLDGLDKITESSAGGDLQSVATQIKRYDLLKKIKFQLSQIKQPKEQSTANTTPQPGHVGTKRLASEATDSITCVDDLLK
jgi:hypothetical protein